METPNDNQTCARCGGRVKEGFAAVSLDGTITPLLWVEGELERERLTRGAIAAGRERHTVKALRCASCGNLTWEA